MMTPDAIFLIARETEFYKKIDRLFGGIGVKIQVFSSISEFIYWVDYDALPAYPCVICSNDVTDMTGFDLLNVFVADEVIVPALLIKNSNHPDKSIPASSVACLLDASFTDNDLLDAIDFLLEKHKKIKNNLQGKNDWEIDNAIAQRIASLSPRERQVLSCVFEGMLNKIIANQLGISIKTVEAHRANMMRKMQARSAVDLIKMTAFAGGV